MSALVCSISGQAPQEPVVSKTSGRLFEKRLVLKHVQEHGTCPITNEPLTEDDLVTVQSTGAVKPRAVSATSIPGLLSLFQSEWDSVMLETFELRKHLEEVRQELSHALYQHDAACRVIARVTRERDEARQLLHNAESKLSAAMANPGARQDAMEVEGSSDGLSAADLAKMSAKASELQAWRKKRPISESLATSKNIAGYKVDGSHPLHKTSQPGILCMDIHGDDNRVLTGGMDHTAIVFNRSSAEAEATLSGHSKKLTAVKFHPTEDIILTASFDKTARVWRKEKQSYSCAHVIKGHTNEVNGLTLHPTGDFFATASADKTWAIHDIATGTTRESVKDSNISKAFTAACFHPDGLLLGTAESVVRVWDVKTRQNALSFAASDGPVNTIAFSENGYTVATAASDCVKVWDLRKVAKNPAAATPVKVLEVPNEEEVHHCAFDFSGTYLAMGASAVRVFHSKTWDNITTLGEGSVITSVGFGKDAKYIASTSKDRTLKFYH